MRVFGWVLAGVLVLGATVAAQADPPGAKIRPARTGPPPDVVRAWNGAAPGWHTAPGHIREWKGGGVPSHWRPGRFDGRSGPYCCWGPGAPTYWVWGPSGGAFDYPFSDWRGPTGGWGNP